MYFATKEQVVEYLTKLKRKHMMANERERLNLVLEYVYHTQEGAQPAHNPFEDKLPVRAAAKVMPAVGGKTAPDTSRWLNGNPKSTTYAATYGRRVRAEKEAGNHSPRQHQPLSTFEIAGDDVPRHKNGNPMSMTPAAIKLREVKAAKAAGTYIPSRSGAKSSSTEDEKEMFGEMIGRLHARFGKELYTKMSTLERDAYRQYRAELLVEYGISNDDFKRIRSSIYKKRQQEQLQAGAAVLMNRDKTTTNGVYASQ